MVTPQLHSSGSSSPRTRNQYVNSVARPTYIDSTASHLIHLEKSIVKTRTGSVLSRGMILKSDHYPSGRALQLDITLQGAPNFRAPKQGGLNVFGVAQPRLQGLKAILSVLGCRPYNDNLSRCIWFSTREEPIVYISGRPYVLRDASEPMKNLALSDRAENLEDIEKRLKSDIIQEASRQGGVILTHLEIETEDKGAIVPTWTAIEPHNVLTLSELWMELLSNNWNIQYHRIPISKTHPIEDNYLDAYVRVLLQPEACAQGSSLLFSCGMGAVRTTFAMCAASIVRRRLLMLEGNPDPYEPSSFPMGNITPHSVDSSRSSTPLGVQAAMSIGNLNANQDLSKSLLRLTLILQHCFKTRQADSAIHWLLLHPSITDNLRKAANGSYSIILSLLGCLDNGLAIKRLVDKIIDSCDHVINLREDILINRIKYSLTTLEDKSREEFLDKATKALEKYFFLIAFASYVEGQKNFKESFEEWLKARIEIWNQVTFLRQTRGSRLNVFAPVSDLSSLARSEFEGSMLEVGTKNDVAITGGQILGDEWTAHVVENRAGIVLRANTLLKSDQWLTESDPSEINIRGAINLRNIPETNIYALGQPSHDAILSVISRVKKHHLQSNKIIWITLREEPIVYINGTPFCLRRDKFSLRNMKDYSGVSADRLEILEERLKSDVISELHAFGGYLLLHTETRDGAVIPVWENVRAEDVCVVKDIMARHKRIEGIELHYRRIPITAELSPDFSDFAELMDVVLQAGRDTPIIINCQLGRGRSTLASIILCMIRRWLDVPTSVAPGLLTPSDMSSSFIADPLEMNRDQNVKRYSYKAINHLLRVIRHGLEVKAVVDTIIDRCSKFFNLRESIEIAATSAEESDDPQQKRRCIERGLHNLERYFNLVLFQAYLNSNHPDTIRNLESFETFVKSRPVFRTFEHEMHSDGIHALKPLEQIELSQGLALSDEVKQVVSNRSGTVLSASTILKSDFFSNLQKLSLPERLSGAPNFRRLPLKIPLSDSELSVPQYQVCGTGIPTIQGLKNVLLRADAGPAGANKAFWTSLREEPVLYVAGRPHVLRLLGRPLENVQSTGITTAVVEQIEKRLKTDVIQELRANSGKLLLHDEMETETGTFEIVPQWEEVSEIDILTPRDVFDSVIREGFKVDYARVPITDEQAPLPTALDQLLTRVKSSLNGENDLIFNCQMGRGRTTTGMVAACLVATVLAQDITSSLLKHLEYEDTGSYPSVEPSAEEVYMEGYYKVILQLVGVLSFGKVAKRITDLAIDRMQDVQNLRKTIYAYKLQMDACATGTPKHTKLQQISFNYLYRYATLIVFADYLVEIREGKVDMEKKAFPIWLSEHREITHLLSRRSLD